MPASRKTLVCALALAVGVAAGALPALSAAKENAVQAPARTFVQAAGEAVRDAATAALHTAQEVSSFALGLIGVEYRFGGNTPETGLDCSGLVRYVFQQVTGVSLPHSAKQMSRLGDRVEVADLKPGDLVFFNTRRFAFSHVGIYLGENQFIHAPRRGREVEIATIDKQYWKKRFNGARRLVGVLPELLPDLIAEATAAPPAAAPADSE